MRLLPSLPKTAMWNRSRPVLTVLSIAVSLVFCTLMTALTPLERPISSEVAHGRGHIA